MSVGGVDSSASQVRMSDGKFFDAALVTAAQVLQDISHA